MTRTRRSMYKSVHSICGFELILVLSDARVFRFELRTEIKSEAEKTPRKKNVVGRDRGCNMHDASCERPAI